MTNERRYELKLRLTSEEMEVFATTAFKRGRMKHQAALKQAMDQWIKGWPERDVSGGTSGITSAAVMGITMTNHEQQATSLLLKILRHGTKNQREAIMWNLRGWAEAAELSIANKGPRSIPETLEELARAAEALGSNEEASRKWLEDLRKLQSGFDRIRTHSPRPRGGDSD